MRLLLRPGLARMDGRCRGYGGRGHGELALKGWKMVWQAWKRPSGHQGPSVTWGTHGKGSSVKPWQPWQALSSFLRDGGVDTSGISASNFLRNPGKATGPLCLTFSSSMQVISQCALTALCWDAESPEHAYFLKNHFILESGQLTMLWQLQMHSWVIQPYI